MIKRLKGQIDKLDHWPLMERLLGMEVRPRQMLRSPLRQGDLHPSFGLFRNQNGQAKWKDFAMDHGDVYQLAQMLHRCDFPEAVRIVAEVAGLQPPTQGRTVHVPPPNLKAVAVKLDYATVDWAKRAWNKDDERFWYGRYGVTRELMEEYDAWPCERFKISRSDGSTTVFFHEQRNPMYVYAINGRAKLYRPFNPNRDFRYIGNTRRNDVFGFARLAGRTVDDLFISAGQKDGLTLDANLSIPSIAFNAESTTPEPDVMFAIFRMAKRIWVVYDNDKTGKLYAKKLAEAYSVPSMRIINISELTNEKDVSDWRMNAGPEALEPINAILYESSQ